MSFVVVSDSSSNLLEMSGKENYTTVPMKILIDGKEHVDEKGVNLKELVEDIESSAANSTSCPNAQEWINAWEGYDEAYGITISSALSASYSSAVMAEKIVKEEDPKRKVYIFDSKATGGSLELIADKIFECKEKGMSFEETVEEVDAYYAHTQIMFLLESLHNLAKNGRLSPSVAKIASALNIRFIGKASSEGTIQQCAIARGNKKALSSFEKGILKEGYQGGRMIISHCLCAEKAESLRQEFLKEYPEADIKINDCGSLCSYYAERGGLIICFETK